MKKKAFDKRAAFRKRFPPFRLADRPNWLMGELLDICVAVQMLGFKKKQITVIGLKY